jgi:AraC-like DNA-binding protein
MPGLVSSGAAFLALECARAVGLDPACLAQQAGLRMTDLSDPDASIPLAKFVALWGAIAAEPRGQDAGLHDLPMARLANLGSLGYAFRNAETVGHAFSLVCRHARLWGAALAFEIRIGERRMALVGRWPSELSHNRPFVEEGFSHVIATIHEITGARPIPIEIRCQFSRPVDADRSARVFGCKLRYDCSETLIAFPESLAHQPVTGRDPALFAIVDRYAQRLAGAPVEVGTLAADVRAVIRTGLAGGEPSTTSIARKLAMSARTLQRRLAEEDLTVSALVDEIRRELSLEYLDVPTLGMSDIAFMLGYSDVTSFQRAFRRWTGQAPATYRRERKARAHP